MPIFGNTLAHDIIPRLSDGQWIWSGSNNYPKEKPFLAADTLTRSYIEFHSSHYWLLLITSGEP